METAKKVFKVSGIVLACILFLACLFVNGWYLWLKKYGAERTLSRSVELGMQETTAGEVEPIFELSYWANAFEIKINEIFDEDADKFYYKAIQYVSNEPGTDIFGNAQSYETNGFLNSVAKWKIKDDYENYSYVKWWGVTVNEYMSDDDWETSAIATSKISDTVSFKVKSGEDLFELGMKGKTLINEVNEWQGIWRVRERYYNIYDWTYLFSLLYNSVRNNRPGTNQYITLEFGDIFKVSEHIGDGVYKEIFTDYSFNNLLRTKDTTKITVKMNIYGSKLDSSADSSIGWFKNSQTYNVSSEQNSYFMGRDVIYVKNKQFTPILNSDTNEVTLYLSEHFREEHLQYADRIYLDVLIDRDKITSAGYTFAGINAESLQDFELRSLKIQYTENGVIKVVDYEL